MNFALAGILLFLLFTALWLRQRATRNAGIVDVGWSLGTGLAGAGLALASGGWFPRTVLVAVLAAIWGARLAWHIHHRSHGAAEDGRYADLRRSWGTSAQWKFFLFFQAQAALALGFALPIWMAARPVRPQWEWMDALGVGLWLLSIAGEALSDAQLQAFRDNPANRGQVCRRGLWAWSRHPNYFFEWIHWWAYVAIAAGSPGWMFTLGAPALMLFFLFKVTGIPATEAHALRSRGEAYRAYQREVSAFFPWFPRRAAPPPENMRGV